MPRQLSLEKGNSSLADILGENCYVKRSRRSPASISSIKRSRLSRRSFAEDDLLSSQRMKENRSAEQLKYCKTGSLSKKSRRIRKYKCLQRNILQEITNLITLSPHKESVKSDDFKDEMIIFEDPIEKIQEEGPTDDSSQNKITYTSSLTGKKYEFFIHDENLLKVPSKFQTKTIEQFCDNDCSSDEDLIQRSIKKLKNSLFDAIKTTVQLDPSIPEKAESIKE